MRFHAALAIALIVLLVATPGLADQTAAQETTEPPPGVVMEVAVSQNGDAQWNVTTAVPIRNESDARAFDRLAEEFESGEAGFSPDIFETVAESASDRTNRTMDIRDVEYETSVVNESGNRTGMLSLSFTWTNFANVSNETIAVGDAFGASGFDSLSANQRLLVRPPPGYGIDSVSPSTQITNGVARWDGPRTFDAGEPAITYEAQPSGLPLEPDLTLLAAGGAVAVVVLATVGYLLLRRRRPAGPAPTPDAAASSVEGDGGSASTAGAEAAAEGGAGAEATAGVKQESNGAVEPADDDIDPELLSDEERVERLLRANNGRMKQADIVKETGWSNAKVSQLLSGMDEDGDIDKLRIGRENLITLATDDE